MPFVLQWKGNLPAGAVYERPVIQLDILPTALAAAGVKLGADAKLDGVDLLPYLRGKAEGEPHPTLYWRFGPQMAIRQGDWKLVRYDAAVDGGKSQGDARAALAGPKLYRLSDDVGESHDLAAEEPAKVEELQKAWDAWNAELPGARRAGAKRGRP